MKCTQCGGTEFEEDRGRADLVCLSCGFVASENTITTDVEFMDGGTGFATAVTRFISDESQAAHNQASRIVTENNARKRIDIICSQLRLGADVAISALNFYQSALFRGLTRGRPAMVVSAVCVYLAARKMRIGLMLLDLSDAVSVNVFTLGYVFNHLKRKLNVMIPEADPCILIERFAAQLDFKNKTPIVCTTAMQLLQRMKKDWLNIGRKPNGLAAAALLVSARIHNFERTEYDVCRVAKIGLLTARKRLMEFSSTASCSLSVDDFFNVSLEEECDPPAFVNNRLKDHEDLKKFELSQDPEEIKKLTKEVENLSKRIDVQLEKLAKKSPIASNLTKSFASLKPDTAKSLLNDSKDPSGSDNQRSDRSVFKEILEDVVDPDIIDICTEDLQILTACSGNELVSIVENIHKMRDAEDEAKLVSNKETKDQKDQEDKKNENKQIVIEDSKIDFKNLTNNNIDRFPIILSATQDLTIDEPNVEKNPLDLEGLDEDEIDSVYMLKPKEVMLKASLWFKENADFLEQRRKKNAEKRRFEEYSKGVQSKRRKQVSRAHKFINESMKDCENLKMISSGKLSISDDLPEQRQSNKINYAALEGLISTDNTPVPLCGTSLTSPLHKPTDKYIGPLLSASIKNIPPSVEDSASAPNQIPKEKIPTKVRFSEPLHAAPVPATIEVGDYELKANNNDDLEEIPDDDYEEEEVNWDEGNDLW